MKELQSGKYKWIHNKNFQFMAGLFLLLICAVSVTVYLKVNELYGSGNDMWSHLYKADLLYKEMKHGNFYPRYMKYWYNGIEPFRYWAPMSYFVVASLEFLAGGSIYTAYCLFAGFSIFVGGFGFILWGRKMNRIPFCTALAILWFFMPESYRVYFCEGNMPRMMSTIVVPYVLYFIWLYLRKDKFSGLIGVLISMLFMTMSHLMLSAMMGVATFMFLLFDCIGKKTKIKSIQILLVMLMAYLICGIYLIPALSGGIVGIDAQTSMELMKSFSKDLLLSINPFYRMYAIVDTFYYGLSVVILCITGILLAKKREKSGYIVTLSILIMTTSSAIAILSKIPMSQLFWMMRFASIAYGYFFFSFIEWKTLRKKFCVIFLGVLVLDLLPALDIPHYYTNTSSYSQAAIDRVQEITKQRTTLLDLSSFGSYPSFGICYGENAIQYSFGWAWQGAKTSPNIVMQNTALEAENYLYVFDRSLELGNDTVMISKEMIGKNGKSEIDLMAAAKKVGYEYDSQTDTVYIFKMDTPKTFGVITEYKGLSIGKYASNVELFYPSFTTANSNYIDDYSFAELSKYEIIYLSGFEFHQRQRAEELVEKLGKIGVKVIIDMAHVPVDRMNNRMHFMGVYSQDITFDYHYPALYYKNSQVKTLDFAEQYSQWNTCYIEGIKNPTGIFYYSNQALPFIGTNDDPNVIFMGINLMFHSTETYDRNTFSVLSDLLGVGLEQLPERKIVPIDIKMEQNKITIQSDYNNVNTTLAAVDSFQSTNDEKLDERNHLLYVNKGTTVVQIGYPRFIPGLTVSVVGVILAVVFFVILARRRKKFNELQK